MLKIIDIHAHILPGLDDGCRTEEEALQLLTSAESQGIEGIIATPHYSSQSRQKGLREAYKSAAEKLNRAFGRPMILGTGQETFWHEELPERLLQGYALPLCDSTCVLVEYDPATDYQTIFRSVRNLGAAGFTPVLAHIERYVALSGKAELRQLKSMGALLQINYPSLEGSILNLQANRCRSLVREGLIDLLGTDMHRPGFRPPRTEKAAQWLEKALGPEAALQLTQENPLAILHGESL